MSSVGSARPTGKQLRRPSRTSLAARLCAALFGAALLGAPCRQTLAGADDAKSAAPPFPLPISVTDAQFKIVSEVFDEQDVARAQEEYVDLRRGRASLLTSTGSGYFVRHLDADEGLAFTYRPYRCVVRPIGEIPLEARQPDADRMASPDGKAQLWSFNAETTVRLDGDGASPWDVSAGGAQQAPARPAVSRPMRLFGVAGLWLMAAQKRKTFMRSNIIYSAASDVYRPALVWKVSEGGLVFEFYFMEAAASDEVGKPLAGAAGRAPTLEMIKIASTEAKSVVRTINILSIERSLPPEVYDGVLSVPLGYGCFSSLQDAYLEGAERPEFVELVRRRRAYANRHLTAGEATWTGRAELEVTASRAGADGAARASDTFSVEIARTPIKAAASGPGSARAGSHVKLIRWRNSREDTKLVLHEILRLKTTVDMLRGGCRQERVPAGADEAVLVRFANGAEFDANLELFRESDDLHFVKVTAGESGARRLHHYEGTAASKELVGWLRASTGASEAEARRTRVVRSYAMAAEADSFELASITIWLLDEAEAAIRESYQIYVVDYREEDGAESAEARAKRFDTSYECHLENEAMRQNRDFAWFQLSYPASHQLLGLVAAHADELKQIYYERYVEDLTRVPRVELLFEADKFKIRTLLLDLPPVELLYERQEKTQLLAGALDQAYMEPDLQHCAHLCRANHCTLMSYCFSARSCTLSVRPLFDFGAAGQPVAALGKFQLAKNANCDTYTIPAALERDQVHRVARLTSILARLQHQNYEPPAGLPPAPDEAALGEAESGLSREEHRAAQAEYAAKVAELLSKEHRLPELAFPVELPDNFLFLLPSKFELERDPMTELGLHGLAGPDELADPSSPYGGDDDQRVPHFHKGLTMARLNIVQMQSNLRPEDANARQVSFHSFRGLNYDQCAMACWDSKCGTFSYCDQGGECVLSSAKTLGHAQALGLVEQAPDCLVAQRDFLGNFVRFPNVYRPQVYKARSSEPVLEPSECALNCMAETGFRCLSFQHCASNAAAGKPAGQCYYQASHHSLNEAAPTETGCDHYARAHLADFVRVDSRRLAPAIVDQLKTGTYTELSVFACADKCSDELPDCTAFQYCLHPGASEDTPARECLTVESKVTPAMLAANRTADQQATLVDETNGADEVVQSGDYLAYDVNCQVFAMRRESSQAHLRDLAFGGLIRSSRDEAASGPASSGMSVAGGLLLYVTVAAATAAATCGAIILASRSESVRRRIERFRIVARI